MQVLHININLNKKYKERIEEAHIDYSQKKCQLTTINTIILNATWMRMTNQWQMVSSSITAKLKLSSLEVTHNSESHQVPYHLQSKMPETWDGGLVTKGLKEVNSTLQINNHVVRF